MTQPSAGLHHVTVVSGDPRANRRFYTDVLGLRLVKKTVNFDAPDTYHLYYGDRIGRPGSALTFFPFANAAPGEDGIGEARRPSWCVPEAALDFWAQRLAQAGLDVARDVRFGEQRLHVRDPDGVALGLVGGPENPGRQGPESDVPASARLSAFDGIDLVSADPQGTARVLTGVFGYRATGSDHGIARFEAVGGLAGEHARSVIDLHENSSAGVAQSGRGSVHHVAFRAADAAHQAALAAAAAAVGLSPTDVIDRQYFQSVYFREPGGVLFEIATDGPGFDVDEPVAQLGEALKLPPQYESRRAVIEAELPAL